MKSLISIIFFFAAISISGHVYAGGAVAGQQQRQKQQQQQIIQQQMILQQRTLMEQQMQNQVEQKMQQTQAANEAVVEVVDINDLWKAFETSSQGWALIMDAEVKVYTVARYIEQYRRQNITIKKSPVEYAQIIDTMAHDNPAMLENPFNRILMIAAIIEYDFENGQDKDAMAKKLLGPQGFLTNKQRLGLKQ